MAVRELVIGDTTLNFSGRFGGVPMDVFVPISNRHLLDPNVMSIPRNPRIVNALQYLFLITVWENT